MSAMQTGCGRNLKAGIRGVRVRPNIPKYLFHSKNVKKEYICHFKKSLIQHAKRDAIKSVSQYQGM